MKIYFFVPDDPNKSKIEKYLTGIANYLYYSTCIVINGKEMKETFDYHIKSTWHLLSKMYNILALQHDISQVIGYALINIEKDGTPVSQLASLLGVESTSLSRLLKSMEQKGLIERRICDEDRRVIRVYLTSEGLDKRKKASEIILNFNDKLAQRLSKPEKENFLKIFNHVKELIQEEINKVQATER